MFKVLDTHVSVDVANLDEARKYLEENCGLEKLRELNRPGVTVAWYPGLELSQAGPNVRPGIVKHVAWQVDDINQATQILKERGVIFESEEPKQIDVKLLDTREIIRFIFFTTPVGLRGELYQVGPPQIIQES